jgi:hypothetical protein
MILQVLLKTLEFFPEKVAPSELAFLTDMGALTIGSAWLDGEWLEDGEVLLKQAVRVDEAKGGP